MRHRWSITSLCPRPAAFEQALGVTYLQANGNSYPLNEAAERGWIEETSGDQVLKVSDVLDDLPWDVSIDVTVLPSVGFWANVSILKGSDRVLVIRNIKEQDLDTNPTLLAEMLNILNGFEAYSEGSERAS